MDIKVTGRRCEGDAYIVDIVGEIDFNTSPLLKTGIEELSNGDRRDLILNLEKVAHIDSTGLGILVGVLKRVREHGGSVNLVFTNVQMRKIFDITGLGKIFRVFADERSAIKAVRETALAIC